MFGKALPLWAIVLLMSAALGRAATIYVPDDYTTIQGAIDSAAESDVVIVRSGTYLENIDFVGKAITLRSESGAASTIIDASGSGSVVVFQSGEGRDSILAGFTITNGTGTYWNSYYVGGGIFCAPGSSPTLTKNLITANSTSVYFGNGAGIFCYSFPLIKENTITANNAYGSRALGGGICCGPSSSPTITDNVISDNWADLNGGGLACEYSSSPLIENNLFSGNSSPAGGGLCINHSSTATVTGNTISGNHATSPTGSGGGICCYSSFPTITNNRIVDNTGDRGAGICNSYYCMPLIEGNYIAGNIAAVNGSGGGIYNTECSPTIVNNVIEDNSAYYGGGIACSGSYSAIIGNHIRHNQADRGGGVSFQTAYPSSFASNVLSGNSASLYGGGVDWYSTTAGYPALVNNTFHGNSAGAQGGALYADGDNFITLSNTIFWNDQAPLGKEIYLGSPYMSITVDLMFCDLEGGLSSVFEEAGSQLNYGTGNIDADPLFFDKAGNDFHLTFNSPCRDTGSDQVLGLPLADVEDDPRIAGAFPDMGADEFYYHLYASGDPFPGSSISIRIAGIPGTQPVTLALGSGVRAEPLQTLCGALFLELPLAATFNLGTIPSGGILDFGATIPGNWQSGEERPFQALLGPFAAGSVLTNLLVLNID